MGVKTEEMASTNTNFVGLIKLNFISLDQICSDLQHKQWLTDDKGSGCQADYA